MNLLTSKLCNKLAKSLFSDAEFLYTESINYGDKAKKSKDLRNKLLNKKVELLFLSFSLEYYIKSLFLLNEYDIFVKSKPTKIHSKSSFDITTSKALNSYNLIENIDMVFPQNELDILLDMSQFKKGLHELRKIRNQELHFATFLDSKHQFLGKIREKKKKEMDYKEIIKEINVDNDILLRSFHNLRAFLKKRLKNKNNFIKT